MPDQVLGIREAWGSWDKALLDARFALVGEPDGLGESWRSSTEGLDCGSGLNTDTYFAAFARAGDYRLTTFDGGFDRFRGRSVEVPRP